MLSLGGRPCAAVWDPTKGPEARPLTSACYPSIMRSVLRKRWLLTEHSAGQGQGNDSQRFPGQKMHPSHLGDDE